MAGTPPSDKNVHMSSFILCALIHMRFGSCFVPLLFSVYHMVESNVKSRWYTVIHIVMVAAVLCCLEILLPDAGWFFVLPPLALCGIGAVYSVMINCYLHE